MKPRCLGVHCDGGYADQIVVPHSKYLLPLDGLDPVDGRALRLLGRHHLFGAEEIRLDVIKDELVLVIGAGGLGLMCVTILKAMGGRGAVVVDIDEKRRAAALEAGARAAVDGAAPDALAQVAAALGGPCWAAIDLVGSPQTAALGFDALGKGGKLMMVGLFGGAAPWSLPLIPMKAVTIVGNYTGNLAETRELLELVRAGAIPKIPIRTRPLSEATETLEDLKAGPHRRPRRADAID